MRNIAVITARSGSKGLKDKNIKELAGKPLLAYSIEAALSSKRFDEVMVSTDSKVYAEIALKYGASVPFLRSAELSTDSAGSWETVLEVLKGYENTGRKFDTVCLLQPTSPLRMGEDIENAYKLLEERCASSITGVCVPEHSPVWCGILPESLSMKDFRNNEYAGLSRQDLPVFYRINGAIYIRKTEYRNNGIYLSDEPEFAYIMPRERSIDIDDEMDFTVAEIYLDRRNSAGLNKQEV